MLEWAVVEDPQLPLCSLFVVDIFCWSFEEELVLAWGVFDLTV